MVETEFLKWRRWSMDYWSISRILILNKINKIKRIKR
jgi:hypothetical protein